MKKLFPVACSRIIITGVLLANPAICSLGGTPESNPPELPAQAKPVEGILVPVPKEIFRTLDQFHNANWRPVQRREVVRWKSQGDQVQVALLLGVVVAEGFIAMEAHDVTEIKQVGKRVLVLTRALGVERTALRRSRSIIDNAERGDWAGARKEWNNVLDDLEQGMIALKSESLSQLVSLSGWMRGTEALSVLIMQNYSADRAQLLRQTAMLDYLERQLAAMDAQLRSQPLVIQLRDALSKIRASIEKDDGALTEETVEEIDDTCRRLVIAVGSGSGSKRIPVARVTHFHKPVLGIVPIAQLTIRRSAYRNRKDL